MFELGKANTLDLGGRNNPPGYPALQGISFKSKSVVGPFEAQGVQLAVLGEADESFGGLRSCAKHSEPHAVPAAPLVVLSTLVIDPRSRGQVDVAARRLFHERGNEDVGAEQILVLDEPGRWVPGVLEEQGTQHRV